MEFAVGASKVDITPNCGSPTRRWHLKDERARIKEIRWPLYARTIALSDGSRTSTITSMEVACLYKTHLDHIRELTRRVLPVSVQDIILHNTHQHSDSFIEYEPSYDIFGINDIAFDLDYIGRIPEKVAASVCLAVEAMTPARVCYTAGAVKEAIASCRRVLMEGEGLVWRSSRPSQAQRELPRGHIDPEVGVAAFADMKGNPLATIYNYACHPSAAGGDSPNVCSADFPGFASAMIEERYGGIVLFLHGCSGDINPGKYVRGDSLDPDDRIADAKGMGGILAEEVLTRLGLVAGHKRVDHFQTIQRDCLLPVQTEAGSVAQTLQEARRALEEWRTRGSDPRTALRKHVISHKIANGRCPVTMSAMAINGLAIGFVPGEPFVEFGERIKRAADAELTLVASTCGEDPFYIPTSEAFSRGGYETGYIATRETGEVLVEEIKGMLATVIARSGIE